MNIMVKHTGALLMLIMVIFSACRTKAKHIVETPDYMKAHPECIIGIYYNHYTNGAISYIQLRADSTFIHVCKFGNLNHADSGKWSYGYDHGLNVIYFKGMTLMKLKEEGNRDSSGILIGCSLMNCNELSISVTHPAVNFYKDTLAGK
jgi:hypothetical protein